MALTKTQRVARAVAIGREKLPMFYEQLNEFYSELEACHSFSLFGVEKIEPLNDIFGDLKEQADIIKRANLAAETSETREFKRNVGKASDRKVVVDKIYKSLESCKRILHWLDNDSDDARPEVIAEHLGVIEKVRMDMSLVEISVELRQEVRDVYRRLRELERSLSNLDESASAAALSRSMSVIDINGSNPQYGRWDNNLLPSFDGTDTDYPNFKSVFQDLCSGYGFSDQRLQLMLCMEKVITNAELRKQVAAIRSHSEQWSFLDQMFLSNTRRFMRILTKMNKMKPVDKPADIVSAIATFKSTLHEVESIVGTEAKDYNQLTLVHIFKDKVPESLRDKIMMELGSMNNPDIKKIVDLLERTRGAMMAGDLSYDASGSRRFRDRAAAAQVSGRSDNKYARAGKDKNSRWNSACFVEGCKDKHPVYRCPVFKRLDVVERKKIVQQKKLCNICLQDGHVADNCDKRDKLGVCGTNNCDRYHSKLLHEATASVNTVYKSSSAPSPCTFLLQLVPVVAAAGTYHAAVMFDSGANLPLVSEKLSNKLKLKLTGRYTTISVADGSESCCPNVLLHLKDRDGNLRQFEAAVMPTLGGANEMRSVHPNAAAEIFEMSPENFTYVSGGLDIIIGNTHPDVFPCTFRKSGQSMLWRTIFGSGFICTSADSAVVEHKSVFKAVSVSGGNLPDFLTSEGFGVQPQALCPGCTACPECKAMADGSTWDQRERQRIIEAGLTLDLQTNRWTGQYAYIEDPHTLPYNEELARKIAEKDRARMIKDGTYDLYVQEFNDAIARGVFKKATPEELKYPGPKFCSSIVVAYKEDSSSTPLRLCANSSLTFKGTSLNQIMLGGPPPMQKIFYHLMVFRGYKVVVVADIRKFYNSILATDFDSQMKRVLFSPTPDGPLEIYLTKVVNFGELAAGNLAVTALKLTSRLFGGKSEAEVKEMYGDGQVKGSEIVAKPELWKEPERPTFPEEEFKLPQIPVAVKLEKHSFIDDVITGAGSKPEAEEMMKEANRIISKGSFSFKKVVYSGDDCETTKVLGVIWKPATDVLSISTRVNQDGRIKGKKVKEDADLCDLRNALDENLTKKMVHRFAAQTFDPIGLASPILLRIKLVLRKTCLLNLGWNDFIPKSLRDELVSSLEDRAEVAKLEFDRCVVPDEPTGPPSLMMFSDGSSEAYACIAYLRWPTKQGYETFLLAAKSRVAPVKTESIPRLELMGCMMSSRLSKSVRDALPFDVARVMFFTDSSCVLSQIVSNSAMLNVFNAHRVGEIQSTTNKDDWRWIPGSHNVADLATRSTCKVSDLGPGSRYRLGPEWLRQDENAWPVKTAEQVKQDLPPEELNAKMVKLCAMQVSGEAAEDVFRFKHRRSFGEAKRVMAVVLQVANTWLKKLKSRQGEKIAAAGDPVYKPSLYNFMAAAELFMVSQSQHEEWINDAKGKYSSLNPVEHKVSLTWPVVGPGGKYVSREIRLLRMIGRGEPAIDAMTGGRKMLFEDMRGLVILEPNNWLASIIMREAHVELHSGVRGTLAESRRWAWIIRARRLSIMEVKKCWPCSLERAKECRVTMKDVLPDKLVPSRPFEAVQVDLLGPLVTRRATAKRRSQTATKKVWVFVVVCRFSGALWLDALEKYDTSSILLSLRKLEAVHCLPKMIVSDMGTQLSGARKILEQKLGSQVEFSWSQIPARAHHFIGQAEKMVGLTKRLLSKKLTNSTVNFNELLVLLAEVCKIMNSRPLTVEAASDAENWRLITPGQLLGNVDRQPLCNVAMKPEDQISCRLKLLENLSAQFWTSYRQEILPKLLRLSKWRDEMAEPLKDGDIVLVTSTNPLMRCLRLGRVTRIEEGRKTARVLFRLTDKSPLEEHPVSVRQLLKVMINN